jgi:hypothetical protein
MEKHLSTDGEDYEWTRIKLPYGTLAPTPTSKVAIEQFMKDISSRYRVTTLGEGYATTIAVDRNMEARIGYGSKFYKVNDHALIPDVLTCQVICPSANQA